MAVGSICILVGIIIIAVFCVAVIGTGAKSVIKDRLGIRAENIWFQPEERANREDGISAVYVTQLFPGSRAWTAGLRSGDILLSANGIAVSSVHDLTENLKMYRGWTNWKIEVLSKQAEGSYNRKYVDVSVPPGTHGRRAVSIMLIIMAVLMLVMTVVPVLSDDVRNKWVSTLLQKPIYLVKFLGARIGYVMQLVMGGIGLWSSKYKRYSVWSLILGIFVLIFNFAWPVFFGLGIAAFINLVNIPLCIWYLFVCRKQQGGF